MTAPQSPGRLPDFVVIGCMKSGTTALFRQLAALPQFAMPEVKEPHFFSDDAVWRRGVDWYRSLFPASTGRLTGEASVSYTRAPTTGRAAERLGGVLPGARLVCVLRDPLARMRSHYRHEVQRARERRSFLDALADTATDYLASSRYATCLAPWVERFGDSRLLVVRFEDLHGADEAAWRRVLTHLGAQPVGRPGVDDRNATADKPAFTPLMRVVHDRGWLRHLSRLPGPVRRAGRSLLVRPGSERYQHLLASAADDVPAEVVEVLAAEAAELRRLVPDPGLSWRSLG